MIELRSYSTGPACIHIQIISNKANSVLGFLRRNFNNCPTRVKSSLYKSLVRPILEYACTIWAPHCQRDVQHIEAIQIRAARFTMNRYGRYESVTNMLHQLDWPILYVRRSQQKLMMYKIINGLVYVQHTNIFKLTQYPLWSLLQAFSASN